MHTNQRTASYLPNHLQCAITHGYATATIHTRTHAHTSDRILLILSQYEATSYPVIKNNRPHTFGKACYVEEQRRQEAQHEASLRCHDGLPDLGIDTQIKCRYHIEYNATHQRTQEDTASQLVSIDQSIDTKKSNYDRVLGIPDAQWPIETDSIGASQRHSANKVQSDKHRPVELVGWHTPICPMHRYQTASRS
jgi:hypothetical protein